MLTWELIRYKTPSSEDCCWKPRSQTSSIPLLREVSLSLIVGLSLRKVLNFSSVGLSMIFLSSFPTNSTAPSKRSLFLPHSLYNVESVASTYKEKLKHQGKYTLSRKVFSAGGPLDLMKELSPPFQADRFLKISRYLERLKALKILVNELKSRASLLQVPLCLAERHFLAIDQIV